MKYFVQNIYGSEIYVILVDEIISRTDIRKREEIVKIKSTLLNIGKQQIILACKIGNEIEYIYGNEKIISELKKNKNSEITWEYLEK